MAHVSQGLSMMREFYLFNTLHPPGISMSLPASSKNIMDISTSLADPNHPEVVGNGTDAATGEKRKAVHAPASSRPTKASRSRGSHVRHTDSGLPEASRPHTPDAEWSRYTYSALPENEPRAFRILELLPARWQEPIRCSIVVVETPIAPPSFEALSYTWKETKYDIGDYPSPSEDKDEKATSVPALETGDTDDGDDARNDGGSSHPIIDCGNGSLLIGRGLFNALRRLRLRTGMRRL